MKRLLIIIGILAVVAAATYLVYKPSLNGVGPSPSPTAMASPTPLASPAITRNGCGSGRIAITQPIPGATVPQEFTLKAIVDNRGATPPCQWTVFEAQAAYIKVLDTSGTQVGGGYLQTSEDWMTAGPTNFMGDVTYTAPSGSVLTLSLEEDNPSGQSPVDSVTFPIIAK